MDEAAALASSFFRSEDGPPRLFHYTSGDGLIGILKTRSLWASQATMLDDARQVHHGRDTDPPTKVFKIDTNGDYAPIP
ncbi:MAG TPA: hypothetical protein VFG23_15755 [Polyangia bacterium]|nr:hypothetical protein [Polyangia bacterium]